jgi:putative nucleotidyltransferase with HDIG domain
MLKRIQVDELQLGMFVHELCGSWIEHPFWRTQFRLDAEAELAQLRGCGIREVWIDTARGLDAGVTAGPAGARARAQADCEAVQQLDPLAQSQAAAAHPAPAVPLQNELGRARRVVREARAAVLSMFNDARLGKAVDLDGAAALVDQIDATVQRSPEAFLSVARLKEADEYTFMHSVAVSGLMIALARQLQLPEGEVTEAGLAGLLHDLGKARIPDAILNKPGQLTDEEFASMRRHPQIGFEMLSSREGVSSDVLDVVLHHHERVDGNGYPHGFSGDRIGRLARMGAICDVYDAITSNRVYKAGWDPAVAVCKMAEWSRTHFDAPLFQAFVKTVGIYPVGSLVRMQSGRLGVVTEQGSSSLLAPKVRVFFSTRSQVHIAPEVLDLSRPGTRDRIVSREDPSAWHFRHLERLWMDS